ncbi:sensor histidine kinase [Rhizosaccharibacter radicis]|uniref:histidine kinase n=1 Tax=Rhizosaccharibacter radicis TaxID=2782605 RepID=A0ABT1VVH9_9PROT|nr:ATP-binding protein [Acetobacteraceae bacterium KSS12]
MLMVDDSPESFMTLRAMLAPRRGNVRFYRIDHVSDVGAGLAAMREDAHDCYIVDYQLRSGSGLDLVRDARAAGITRPIVMLTGSDMVDQEAAEAGATDFLIKGAFDRATLERTIRYAIGNAESVRRVADVNARLEFLVEERTRQYVEANARLLDQIAAREEAERALVQAERLQAIGRMTGSVAHDFNNVLTALFGSLELLRRRLGPALDPRVEAPLNNAMEAGRVGERIVESLLSFARSRPVAPSLLSVADVVEQSETLLRLTLGADVALAIVAEPGLPPVTADRQGLERTLLNLAANARDAMRGQPDPRLEIAVLSARTAANTPAIELRVEDNGPGMLPEVLEHAFEPFFSTKEGGGTGLGLAQVYGFAKQSGGTAVIERVPTRGVRIRLLLPASE